MAADRSSAATVRERGGDSSQVERPHLVLAPALLRVASHAPALPPSHVEHSTTARPATADRLSPPRGAPLDAAQPRPRRRRRRPRAVKRRVPRPDRGGAQPPGGPRHYEPGRRYARPGWAGDGECMLLALVVVVVRKSSRPSFSLPPSPRSRRQGHSLTLCLPCSPSHPDLACHRHNRLDPRPPHRTAPPSARPDQPAAPVRLVAPRPLVPAQDRAHAPLGPVAPRPRPHPQAPAPLWRRRGRPRRARGAREGGGGGRRGRQRGCGRGIGARVGPPQVSLSFLALPSRPPPSLLPAVRARWEMTKKANNQADLTQLGFAPASHAPSFSSEFWRPTTGDMFTNSYSDPPFFLLCAHPERREARRASEHGEGATVQPFEPSLSSALTLAFLRRTDLAPTSPTSRNRLQLPSSVFFLSALYILALLCGRSRPVVALPPRLLSPRSLRLASSVAPRACLRQDRKAVDALSPKYMVRDLDTATTVESASERASSQAERHRARGGRGVVPHEQGCSVSARAARAGRSAGLHGGGSDVSPAGSERSEHARGRTTTSAHSLQSRSRCELRSTLTLRGDCVGRRARTRYPKERERARGESDEGSERRVGRRGGELHCLRARNTCTARRESR